MSPVFDTRMSRYTPRTASYSLQQYRQVLTHGVVITESNVEKTESDDGSGKKDRKSRKNTKANLRGECVCT